MRISVFIEHKVKYKSRSLDVYNVEEHKKHTNKT